MGRKMLPEVIQKNRGDTSKGKKKPKVYPQGRNDIWAPPSWFNKEQRAQWDYAVNNAPVGLLTGSDRETLIAWTVASVEYVKAVLEVQRSGQVVQTKDGRVMINPYMAVMNKQVLIMLKTGSEMGFSPAARASLGSNVPEGATTPAIPFGGSGQIVDYIEANPDRIDS